jgi:hypothetical protein
VIVVVLPDTGRNYLSKFYDDQWLRDRDLLDGPATSAVAWQVPAARTTTGGAS